MAADWLMPVGSKEAIPPGQVETKVTVCFLNNHGMMDAVHIGCHDKGSQDPVNSLIHKDVTVIKHRCGVQ